MNDRFELSCSPRSVIFDFLDLLFMRVIKDPMTMLETKLIMMSEHTDCKPNGTFVSPYPP